MALRTCGIVVAVLLAGCSSRADSESSPNPAAADVVTWTARIPWSGDGRVECVRIGDADAASPGPEVVGVDEAGRVIVVRFPDERAEVVFRHTTRLTGLLVADVDPEIPGSEIYAGGHLEGESGGAAFQIALVPGGPPRVRLVYRGDAFVHAMGCIPPAAPGAAPQLLVTDYAASVHLATPTAGSGAWPSKRIHVEPPTDVPEGTEIKDVVVGAIEGGSPRQAFVAVKSGRGVLLDVDRGTARAIHVEPGGIARAALDSSGRLWLACTSGRAVLLERGPQGWTPRTLFQDADGLRGIALGSFAIPGGGRAPAAIFGYSRRCHLLREQGGSWEAIPVFEDSDRGHWLAAADLVPGNGGDELALASYAKRISILVPERAPRAAGTTSPAR